ncbi:MAG: hypothetical protein L3J47_10315 [Sulfurovum sp.]|nr:hypothetical protein [Sulfurovum sp.]
MLRLWKKFFTDCHEKKRKVAGRTFRRILCGNYFGLRDYSAAPEAVKLAKLNKIDQIQQLGLVPKFVRYIRKKVSDEKESQIVAAYVAFQKEVFDPKLNMVYVTELSFIVLKEEFEEFEEMAGVSLKKDFRDIDKVEKLYKGEERRRETRLSPFDMLKM